jgi:hypothetical protein
VQSSLAAAAAVVVCVCAEKQNVGWVKKAVVISGLQIKQTHPSPILLHPFFTVDGSEVSQKKKNQPCKYFFIQRGRRLLSYLVSVLCRLDVEHFVPPVLELEPFPRAHEPIQPP